MEQIKDGGPAFPCSANFTATGEHATRWGMSLRDWFAGQALTGWMFEIPNNTSWPIDAAKQCYAVADAMLAARGAKP